MPLKGPLSLADRFCAPHDWVGGETLTECPDCAAEQRDRYRIALARLVAETTLNPQQTAIIRAADLC